jgi:hypothetical protein
VHHAVIEKDAVLVLAVLPERPREVDARGPIQKALLRDMVAAVLVGDDDGLCEISVRHLENESAN